MHGNSNGIGARVSFGDGWSELTERIEETHVDDV